MYYPLVEQDAFASLEALCLKTGFDRGDIDRYVINAQIEGSPLILCDQLVLGNPANKICAALQFDTTKPSVILWAALIAEASDDRNDVLRFIAESRDTFERTMADGEFIGRRKGTMS